MNIAIIATLFQKKEIDLMLTKAQSVAKKEGLVIAKEIRVPGSFEIPLMLSNVLKDKQIDGAVVLGIIERGKTKHGFVMGQVVLSKVIDLELLTGKPVGIGILGPEILSSQIEKRLFPYATGAVLAVSKMLTILPVTNK